MKEVRRNREQDRMHGYMESFGGKRKDSKSEKAFESFKRPVWYLNNKSKSNEKNN